LKQKHTTTNFSASIEGLATEIITLDNIKQTHNKTKEKHFYLVITLYP